MTLAMSKGTTFKSMACGTDFKKQSLYYLFFFFLWNCFVEVESCSSPAVVVMPMHGGAGADTWQLVCACRPGLVDQVSTVHTQYHTAFIKDNMSIGCSLVLTQWLLGRFDNQNCDWFGFLWCDWFFKWIFDHRWCLVTAY